jgi:hypothetical protein
MIHFFLLILPYSDCMKSERRKGNITVAHWWFMPVILATQEAEIRRIAVRSQPRQMVCKTLSQKNLSPKRGLVEWLSV